MRAAALAAALLSSASAQTLRRDAPHVSLLALAGTSACQELGPEIEGGTQYFASGLSSGKCFAVVMPTDTNGLVYREVIAFSDGMIMVFSSYGPGSDVKNLTSARVYYVFPRSSPLRLGLDRAAGAVLLRLPDGGTASFRASDAQLFALDRGQVSVSPNVDPAERGGVEIAGYRGLLLDAGFRMGELPTGLPNGDSEFRSEFGQLCKVKNSELFAFGRPDGEHPFLYDDAGLSAWLKTRCPGLAVSF